MLEGTFCGYINTLISSSDVWWNLPQEAQMSNTARDSALSIYFVSIISSNVIHAVAGCLIA